MWQKLRKCDTVYVKMRKSWESVTQCMLKWEKVEKVWQSWKKLKKILKSSKREKTKLSGKEVGKSGSKVLKIIAKHNFFLNFSFFSKKSRKHLSERYYIGNGELFITFWSWGLRINRLYRKEGLFLARLDMSSVVVVVVWIDIVIVWSLLAKIAFNVNDSVRREYNYVNDTVLLFFTQLVMKQFETNAISYTYYNSFPCSIQTKDWFE